jgi:hypothetical protein
MKFNEHAIIKSKFVNRYEIFGGSGDVEHIIKNKMAGRNGNNRRTNMSHHHNCAICYMDLIRAGVGLLHGELIKVSSNVIGSTGISVLIIVAAAVGGGCDRTTSIMRSLSPKIISGDFR